MVESLKKSKFEWFDEIPLSWGESKISYLFEIGRGRVISQQELKENGKFPVYSSQTKDNGCMGMIETYDFDDNLITWTTDGANAGTVFIREGKFNCTNVCGTLKPILDIELKYYYYYLQFVTQFYKRPDTNGAKIMNNEMANIHALIPPKQTQIRIAEFLDKKTAEIDTIIQKKENLLLLLEENKKAIINEAVTKGINPNAPMKDSGIEWIGEIPEHWEVSKLKYLVSLNSNDKQSDSDFKLALDNIESWTGNLKSNESSEFEGAGNVFKKGDVLFNKLRPYLAKVYHAEMHGVCVNELLVLTALQNIESKFLFYKMLSSAFIEIVDSSTYGAKMPRANWDFIGDITIPYPCIDEQNRIIKYLEKKQTEITYLIRTLQSQIEKLKEYRQAIISEAVTGKLEIA